MRNFAVLVSILLWLPCGNVRCEDNELGAHGFAESGDVKIHYVTDGEGPLVVLVHGWPELSYSWRHQMPALAKAGYRVVAPDMRGYGGSDAPKAVDAYTIQKLTQDIVNVIKSSGESRASEPSSPPRSCTKPTCGSCATRACPGTAEPT